MDLRDGVRGPFSRSLLWEKWHLYDRFLIITYRHKMMIGFSSPKYGAFTSLLNNYGKIVVFKT